MHAVLIMRALPSKILLERNDVNCISLLDFGFVALTEVLEAMLQSKKSQTELAVQIKNDSHLRERLLKFVSTLDNTKIDAESREADPEWFEGLHLMKAFAM